LKPGAFDEIARFFGFQGNYLYSYAMYDINPNDVAAFPSLHAAYPTLAFLFARRAFGRIGWLMLGYAACVWFAVIYLGDHYLVDVLGGIGYALVAYWAVIHAPGWFRRLVDRAADDEIESTVEGAGLVGGAGLAGLGRRVRWPVIVQGLVLIAVGATITTLVLLLNVLGGYATPFYLLPSALALIGLWRIALGVFST
ncbi:MAG: phosphatase PAP2 family protein, partial [Candidatus Limnocylindrales bacterium]